MPGVDRTAFTEIKRGVCKILVDGADIGQTRGDVRCTIGEIVEMLTVDEYGDSPVDMRIVGSRMEAEFSASQYVGRNLSLALGQVPADADECITIGRSPGTSLRANAQPIVLHPIRLEDSDVSEDIGMHVAVADPSSVQLAFGPKVDRGIPTKLVALVDPTKSDGRRLGYVNGPAVSA